jgi:hypothetical protein
MDVPFLPAPSDALIEVVPKNWTGFLSMNSLSERTTKDVKEKTHIQRGIQGKSSHGSVEGTRTD